MNSSLRLLGWLSIFISVFAIWSFSVVQSQEDIDVQLEEIAKFGTGINQGNVSYENFLASPDQKHIAVLSADSIEVWGLDIQKLVTTINKPFGVFGSGVFAWSPDSSQLATIALDTELSIWSASTGELIQTYH